jgi:hypothetical protein
LINSPEEEKPVRQAVSGSLVLRHWFPVLGPFLVFF